MHEAGAQSSFQLCVLSAGIVDARKNEERQGVNPAPADLELLARLRLDACDSSSLMVEQYKVPIHLHSFGNKQTHICAPISTAPNTCYSSQYLGYKLHPSH